MRSSSIPVGLLLACAVSCAAAAGRIVLPDDVVPVHYEIEFSPRPTDLTFTGTARIEVDVRRETRSIVLNAAQLAIDKATLSGASAPAAVSLDTVQQTATFAFQAPVSVGHHELTIVYRGKINRHAAGLFALDYDGPQGRKRALYTQFENSDARLFMPCWDEPARKATFTLVATVPAGEMAVANTPIDSVSALPGGLARVRFASSPRMSSYLVFFALGDFERIARRVNGVDVGVVFKRGDGARAGFALDAAAHLLPYYEEYFGVKYPLPKLDLVAGPGTSQFFAAMENWGAIFFFESYLLDDERLSTERDRRVIYENVAHEMAHQWFGDLVTMAWWDDLWLNEGFAEWMQGKATAHFHPEWKLELEVQNSKEAALEIDARRGTHPVVQPVLDVLAANEAFDTITYLKGEAVVRMLETYAGEEPFRRGVQSYIKAHAYGNTVTDDLWRELDKSSSAAVTDVAHDFTLQDGVPLVRVTNSTGGWHLTQERFAADDSGAAPTTWRVPVLAAPLATHEPWRGVVSRSQPADIAGSTTAGIVVNAGQAGYFRTLYAPAALSPLVAQFRTLSAQDELGLLNDSHALGYDGRQPLTDFLSLAAQSRPDMDPTVMRTVAGKLSSMDRLYEGLEGQSTFRVFSRRVLSPILARTGWSPAAGENQNVTLLRASVLAALSECHDDNVIATARRLFAQSLKDPQLLSGERRRSVLAIVAEHADLAAWERLHALAQSATETLEKAQLYELLGTTFDRDLAARALQLALSDEPPVTTRPELIASVAQRHPEMAFDFTAAHRTEVLALLEPDSRNTFVPKLASRSFDPSLIPRLRAYAEAHIPATARQPAERAAAAIAYYGRVRSGQFPAIDRWLDARGG
jgi:aminopeptidase N